jgi:uncharacterized protein YndB with AHSA1/START domain
LTVTSVHKDPDALTMTISAEFAAPPERIWQLWADPRQLERWWGPPMFPATVTTHEFRPGGAVAYYMTGPEGDRHAGWWEIVDVDRPRSLAFRNGFSDADGRPDPNLPATDVRVALDPLGDGRTRMSMTSIFPSREAMEELLKMGMEEGMTEAVGQIDDLLAAAP